MDFVISRKWSLLSRDTKIMEFVILLSRDHEIMEFVISR